MIHDDMNIDRYQVSRPSSLMTENCEMYQVQNFSDIQGGIWHMTIDYNSAQEYLNFWNSPPSKCHVTSTFWQKLLSCMKFERSHLDKEMLSGGLGCIFTVDSTGTTL